MSISNAITLPRPDGVADVQRPARRLRRSVSLPRERSQSHTRRDAGTLIATASLGLIVLCSALIVLSATARPSLLAAQTRPDFFPSWMAGPLGGLWSPLGASSTVLRWGVSLAMILMFAGYALSIRHIPRVRARWVVGAIVAVHLIFFLAPPMMLTDVFNYINYGRMEIVHHLNPYTSVPALEPHLDPSFSLSNWHQLSSPYGPLFTIITFAFVPLGVAGSFWAIKALLMFASLATVLLVWKSARLLGRDPTRAIFILGLNPIVLMWGLGGDHNDFIMVFFLIFGVYLLLRSAKSRGLPALSAMASRAGAPVRGLLTMPAATNGHGHSATNGNGHSATNGNGQIAVAPATKRRSVPGGAWAPLALELLAGASLVAAVAVKASAAVIVPVLLIGLAHDWRRLLRVMLGVLLGAIALGACTLIAFGPHLPAVETQASLVTEFSFPNLLGLALGQGGATNTLRAILTVGLVGAVAASAWYAWRRRDSITAAGWASVALIATLSWVLPWYVLWLLPFAALSGSPRLRRTTLALGVYLIAIWMPVSSSVMGTLGLHPSKTPVGEIHQRQMRTLERP